MKIAGQLRLGLCFGALGLWGCSAGTEADRGSTGDEQILTGSLQAALSLGEVAHDVTSVTYKVVAGGDPCDAPAITQTTVSLEEEALPSSVQPAGGGSNHLFSDALFVLPPGDYHVCVTPMAEQGPSRECAATEGDGTVVEGQTTEILLISQCNGEGTGGLDVIVAFNDPPQIDDLDIASSKFVTTCDDATLSAVASDPNGDAVTFAWSQVSGPAAGSITGVGSSVTFNASVAGDYEIELTVTDIYGAHSSLTFPVHVSEGDCTPQVCDGGTDPGTGAAYVVCEANANTAWISANYIGQYHPRLICQTLGYADVQEWGGTCGNVCGYCEAPTSCESHGIKLFDHVWNDGAGANCGSDALGPIICNTVQWTCTQ